MRFIRPIRWIVALCGNEVVPFEIAGRRAGDPAVLVASNQKAKELLGWELKYSSIENILKTALQWEQNKTY